MISKWFSFPLAVFVLAAPMAQAEDDIPSVTSAPVTLKQCYAWAMDRSEDLKIRKEDIRQSQAAARAALGNALPHLSWQWTDTWQDPDGVDELSREGFGGFVQKEQVDSKLSLTQPIFSGFREFSSSAGLKKESRRHALMLDRASLDLFQQTAAAFYDVVNYETNRENTYASLTLAEGQVKQLKDYMKIGKSRSSEVYTAEAHSAALRAQLDRLDAQINTSREELSYLTGHDLFSDPLRDEISSTPAIGSLEAALIRARGRTDLRAQQEEVAAKKLQIRYEKGSYWPTSDITGNYYTRRAIYLSAIDWDVILSLRVPIYQGGTVAANVRAAESAYQQALLTYEQMERQIMYSIRKIYGELYASVREAQSLEKAAHSAQQSYDSLRKEYRYGLVTNLDVLQALDFLQAQKSARDAARLQTKKLFIDLNVALETLP